MDSMWMVQNVEEAKTEAEAQEIFAQLQTQQGYQGGRIIPPSPAKPGWRVQTFYEDAQGWLPDGCRRVLVLPGLRRLLGLA
jgi:hypothetical protein